MDVIPMLLPTMVYFRACSKTTEHICDKQHATSHRLVVFDTIKKQNLFILFAKAQFMKNWKRKWKKIWYFIWEDNSIWSWIVNIALAFILIKFIVYPGLGFLLQTSHPVVAVVSESMEHNNGFDDWWQKSSNWYINNSINKEDFDGFPLKNGFNKGDIMVLKGKKPENIEIGDVIVFWSAKKVPIIHRVVKKWQDNGMYFLQTKGDHNQDSIKTPTLDETKVSEDYIVGNAILRIPLLGYIKIWFVELVYEPVMKPIIEFILQKG